ncbi:hypothetical protein TNCV_1979031 [Trichonephila clavipes]|nr:hypothetical protein TNCV_1979031 [Trichonephila clavipes]
MERNVSRHHTELVCLNGQSYRALALEGAQQGSFAMRNKGGNRLVPGLDYMVDALKLPNQAPKASGESLQTCVAWRCPDRKHTSSVGQFWLFLVNR